MRRAWVWGESGLTLIARARFQSRWSASFSRRHLGAGEVRDSALGAGEARDALAIHRLPDLAADLVLACALVTSLALTAPILGRV